MRAEVIIAATIAAGLSPLAFFLAGEIVRGGAPGWRFIGYALLSLAVLTAMFFVAILLLLIAGVNL